MHHALAGQGDEFHLALVAGLEAHRVASGDVESKAMRRGAVKAQRSVRLEEVVVAADLDRPVAGVRDEHRFRLQPDIGLEGFIGFERKDFAWDHGKSSPSRIGANRAEIFAAFSERV